MASDLQAVCEELRNTWGSTWDGFLPDGWQLASKCNNQIYIKCDKYRDVVFAFCTKGDLDRNEPDNFYLQIALNRQLKIITQIHGLERVHIPDMDLISLVSKEALNEIDQDERAHYFALVIHMPATENMAHQHAPEADIELAKICSLGFPVSVWKGAGKPVVIPKSDKCFALKTTRNKERFYHYTLGRGYLKEHKHDSDFFAIALLELNLLVKTRSPLTEEKIHLLVVDKTGKMYGGKMSKKDIWMVDCLMSDAEALIEEYASVVVTAPELFNLFTGQQEIRRTNVFKNTWYVLQRLFGKLKPIPSRDVMPPNTKVVYYLG